MRGVACGTAWDRSPQQAWNFGSNLRESSLRRPVAGVREPDRKRAAEAGKELIGGACKEPQALHECEEVREPLTDRKSAHPYVTRSRRYVLSALLSMGATTERFQSGWERACESGYSA